MLRKRGDHRKAQVWVETVIYTLIALVLIGTVLSIVKPKIEQSQDKAVLDQSLNLMKDIDSILTDIKQAPGNQRVIELGIKKGTLTIDGVNDRIIFEMESRNQYSEPGEDVEEGASGIIIHTEKKGKLNDVTLTKYYGEDYNLTYSGKDQIKSLTKAGVSYSITLLNKGQLQITDPSSSCATQTVEADCTDYSTEYTKSCIGGKCKYTSSKRTINIEVS